MHQIIYYSRLERNPASGSTLSVMRDIVDVSQRNNARDNISGALILDAGWFLQILEGEKDVIERTYSRIQSDPRHSQVTLMDKRQITTRYFPNWSMGGTIRSLDVQEIFLNHGIGGPVDPTSLTANTVLALACDLKAFEASRKAAK